MTDAQRRNAIQVSMRIFDTLEKAGFINKPADVWGWGDVKLEVQRLIMLSGFGVDDVIAPVRRKQFGHTLAPNSPGKK